MDRISYKDLTLPHPSKKKQRKERKERKKQKEHQQIQVHGVFHDGQVQTQVKFQWP